MAVQQIPASVFQKLLITEIAQKENKHVNFSDIYPVKTFRKTDAPIQVANNFEYKVLELAVSHLKRRVRQLERENKVLRTESVTSIPATPVTPRSDRTITSPPTTANDWTRREIALSHPPANVRAALANTAPRTPPVARQTTPPPQEPQPAKPSVLKRIVGMAGVLCVIASPLAFFSIVALGPAGIGVALGIAALGAGFMYLAHRMK